MDKAVKVLVVLFAAVGVALFGYHWISGWHEKAITQAVEKEQNDCLQRVGQMQAELDKLNEQVRAQAQGQPQAVDLANVFGSDKPPAGTQAEEVDCKQVTAQVVAFFKYLDSKNYAAMPDGNVRAEELFDRTYKQLAAKPPTNVGELEDIASLLGNVTHLYRVLGKDRVALIKEMLRNESAVIEPAMSVMFTWMTSCGDSAPIGIQRPNLKVMYDYACFFLNTMGGRSYLLRRDSKIRMLVNYYSILIVDMANDAKLNPLGIDIRPYLDYLMYDLNNQKGLMYRQRYLTRLAALHDKYQ